jgi:hypothetical protein
MPRYITPRQWEIYHQRRFRGATIKIAAREAGIGYATAKREEAEIRARNEAERAWRRAVTDPSGLAD